MVIRCDTCNGDNFKITAGFYFCSQCGTQSQFIREYEHDTIFNKSLRTTIKKTKEKDKEKDVENQATSWEQFNYILLGMVDELIGAGAKEDLKITVLQLWTAYLSKIEVAFVSRKKAQLPKLSCYYRHKDAQIIYNYQRSRRSHSRSTSKSGISSIKSVTSSVRRTRKNLLKSVYDQYQQSVGSLSMDLSDTIDSMKLISDSDTSAGTVCPKFNRYSRKTIKTYKRKRHRNGKEIVDNDNKTEPFPHKANVPQRRLFDTLSRTTLYMLLYLALNHNQDQIQLGDMLRYVREGHLTWTRVHKFMPDNLRQKTLQFDFAAHEIVRHVSMRQHLAIFLRTLKIKIQQPNLLDLCKRYIIELNLPSNIINLIDILIRMCPPKMAFKRGNTTAIPNYEGRAMAYIILILKLLFGLDDQREQLISKSAIELNHFINTIDNCKCQPLFVWSDWVQFIEMRTIILSQCYFPIADSLSKLRRNGSNYMDLYVDHLIKQKTLADEEDLIRSRRETTDRKAMNNLQTICEQIYGLHQMNNMKVKQSGIDFPASLTPHHTYFDRLLKNPNEMYGITIPTFMYEIHSDRDICAYLRPRKLVREMREHGIRVRVERHQLRTTVQFESAFRCNTTYPRLNRLVEYCFDMDDKEWHEDVIETQKSQKETERKERIVFNDRIRAIVLNELQLIDDEMDRLKLEWKTNRSERRRNKSKSADPIKTTIVEKPPSISDIFSFRSEDNKIISGLTNIDDCILMAGNLNSNESGGHGNGNNSSSNSDDSWNSDEDDEPKREQSNEEQQQQQQPIIFNVSNFDYWITLGIIYTKANIQFNRHLNEMPRSFQWLLRQCAQMIECYESDLYQEVMILENYFAHIIEPLMKQTESAGFKTQDLDQYRDIDNTFFQTIISLQSKW